MSRNVGDLSTSLKIGDVSGGNYTEIETDGTVKRNGAATCWDDMVTSLIGRRLYSNTGKVDYDYDENNIKFQPGGSITNKSDRVNWNWQKLHAIKATSALNVHIHLEQTSTDAVVFTLKYRIQKNGSAKTTAWTTLTCDVSSSSDTVYTYSSGTLNQIVKFPSIDLTGTNISDIIECQMARTDSTASDIYATYVDAHVEFDTDGSRTEWSM